MPCYNEQATVATVIDRVLGSAWVGEIVIVDDCSTDGTREILDYLDDPRIRVLHHEINRGKGAALRTGFAVASLEVVIVQDADLEYDPDDCPSVISPLLDGRADVVYGSRFIGSRPHRVLYYGTTSATKS